jgi:hypothetical protein
MWGLWADDSALSAGGHGSTTRFDFSPFRSGFYSPGGLTFGSAHNLRDFTAGRGNPLYASLTGHAGYRWLKFATVGEPDVRVQNEMFAGLSWRMEPSR